MPGDLVEPDIGEREMAETEVTTYVRNPALKRKFKAQRGKVVFQKSVSPVRSGVARRRAPDPPSDADDPIIEATGRTDSRKRAKSLAGVVTPEKLKEKRTPSTSNPKQRPSKKAKASADAGDFQERRSSRLGRSKGYHSMAGTMEVLPGDKVHMSIRGSNTEIDVTLTSPGKRVLNTQRTNPSISESEDAGDTEPSVRSKGGKYRRSSRKVPLKKKSSRKLLLLPSLKRAVSDGDVGAAITDEGGQHYHKHGEEDPPDGAQEILSTNDVNADVDTEHVSARTESGTIATQLTEAAVQDGGAGTSYPRSMSLISGDPIPSKSARADLGKAQPGLLAEEEVCTVQVAKASPMVNQRLVQENTLAETADDMYEPAATEATLNTSRSPLGTTAGALSPPTQVIPTVNRGRTTLGVDSTGCGDSQRRRTVADVEVGELQQPGQAERSFTFQNTLAQPLKFGCNLVYAIPAPSFRSTISHTHGHDWSCNRGGQFKNPGGNASSGVTSVTTPQPKRTGTISNAVASASRTTKTPGTPTASGSRTPLGCSSAPRSVATIESTGAVGRQEAERSAAAVGEAAPIESSVVPVNSTPVTPSIVALATVQAPSSRSPPYHTHGKDSGCNKGGQFKNPGGTASSALTNVTTPQPKKDMNPSSAVVSASGTTKPPGTRTPGGSTPPVRCSPPPTSVATIGTKGGVGSQEGVRSTAAVGASTAIASAVVPTVSTPVPANHVVHATEQAPPGSSPPSNTDGKDCPRNHGGGFRNPGASAITAMTTVATPEVKKTGTPSTAVTNISGTTKPPRTPTPGGCNPPVGCSAPPTPSNTIGTAGAVACQEGRGSPAAVGTSIGVASPVADVVRTAETAAVAASPLSSELSVKKQLKAMLERMTPRDRATWLRESAEDLMQRNGVVEGGRGKSGHTEEIQKENGKTQKSRAGEGRRELAQREASEAAKQQKDKERHKRRREEERRKAVEESERKNKVREVERQLKELENYRSKLMGTGKGKGTKVEMSPRESQKRTPSNIRRDVEDLRNAMQVSAPSKKKVTPTHPAVSSDASGSTSCSDPLLLGVWEAPKDIPPVEMNSLHRPTGRYWEHLANFAFKRAAMTFPNWDISWPRQNSVRKVLFVERLKQLYPGGWDTVWVMQKVGGNIRQRRVRMRNNFKRFNRKENAPVPPGLALDSWNAIYDQLSNPKYQEKADKCKMAAEERSRKKAFSHKLGPKGVAGLITKFSDEFDQEPTEEEIYFGKENGVPDLIAYTHQRLKMQKSTHVGGLIKKGAKKYAGKGSTSEGRGQSSTQPRKVKQQPENKNDTTLEESARTSSSDEEEDNNTEDGTFGRGTGGSEESNDSDEDEDGEEDEESETPAEENDENEDDLEEDSEGRSGSEDDGDDSNCGSHSDSESG